MTGKTALISGGAGFIGSHLCERLLKENFKVICIDNLITGEKGNIQNFSSNPDFSFIEKNVIEIDENLINEKIDYIFHLASPASPNKKSSRSYINLPMETLLVNSQGTFRLLELARANNSKFLYASSSEIYGDPEVSPQKEDYFGNVNPVGIRSVYDEGKRFGEAMTMAYVRKNQADARIIRIFNIYGPKMRADDGRVVSNFINQAIKNEPLTVYGDGTQTRSICFINDLVEGLYLAITSDKTKGEVLNLGNPEEKTILELANIIKDKVGSSSSLVFEPLPQDDPKQRNPDIIKAKNLLEWAPKVSIDQGLRETIEYFRGLK
ncbi:MAG: UDP-glucuronic acid decarboxylase family protein [Patescibacteria group bacterium]